MSDVPMSMSMSMSMSMLSMCPMWRGGRSRTSHGRMKLSQSTSCGQTVPRRLQSSVTWAAPRSKAVRMFSMANAPMPRMTTRCPCHRTFSLSPASPRRTAPTKLASPRSVRLRGTPSLRLVHTTTVPLRTSKGSASAPHTPTTFQPATGGCCCGSDGCPTGASCTLRTSHPRKITPARDGDAPPCAPSAADALGGASAGGSTSPRSSRRASARISEWCEWFVLGVAGAPARGTTAPRS